MTVAPTITTPMEGQQLNVIEGSNGAITCTATANTASTVVWQNSDGSSLSNNRLVSGIPVISSTGNVTRVSVDLMVIGAMRSDNGMYRCSASNIANTTIRNVIITIQCKQCISIINIEHMNLFILFTHTTVVLFVHHFIYL